MTDNSLDSKQIGEHQMKRSTPWQTLSARVISLVSRKGGVGKTTSAVNLGAAFALSGHTVLVVGTDPQCGVARTLGYGPEDLDGSLPEIFTEGRELTHLAQTSPLKNLYFISPGITSLAQEEHYLDLMQHQADTFVAEIDRARNLYDTIIIDCPPNLSAATRAALLASDSYLVPVQAEELCRDSLQPLIGFIDAFRERVFPEGDQLADSSRTRPVDLEGLFLTMNSARTRMGRHVAARVSEDYQAKLFTAAIPRTIRLSEMALRGKPAVIYDRRSPGSRAYFELADEILCAYADRHGTRPHRPMMVDAELPEELEDYPEFLAGESTRPAALVDEEATDRIIATQENPEGDGDPEIAGGLDRFLADLRAARVSSGAAKGHQMGQGPVPVSEPSASNHDDLGSRAESDRPVESTSESLTEAFAEGAEAAPEMVSLDELLAEEERGAEERSDWDEDRWDHGGDPYGRPN